MNAYDIAAQLPPIEQLRARGKALAVLERIIDSSGAYYTYTRAWGEDEAVLMSNGSGDDWAVVFTADGAFIWVFDHESPMSPYRDPDHGLWPGLLDGLPPVFTPQLNEPAFSDDAGQFAATAVLWRLAGDDRWRAAEGIEFPPDDSTDGAGMLRILSDDIVDRYTEFASDYYEIDVDRAVVEHVVAHRPLTDAVVQALNPEATLAALYDDVAAIGYPMTAT
ncbi:hypothetical protein Cme02nite_36030 [Catellatospora methionotrophica]|uniref:Uncharacterized protein n=1 Tax=Catellatospora methionotrophica TaxID=121620 RepID=A0A8J3PF40_9ACTN|nr:hypothetical protein [Catellatospora methionotrophica]GIG15271.1 hypothetical protein Cme02nite_36030 [Catellatospora methionotrophica]